MEDNQIAIILYQDLIAGDHWVEETHYSSRPGICHTILLLYMKAEEHSAATRGSQHIHNLVR